MTVTEPQKAAEVPTGHSKHLAPAIQENWGNIPRLVNSISNKLPNYYNAAPRIGIESEIFFIVGLALGRSEKSSEPDPKIAFLAELRSLLDKNRGRYISCPGMPGLVL